MFHFMRQEASYCAKKFLMTSLIWQFNLIWIQLQRSRKLIYVTFDKGTDQFRQ